MAIWDDLVLAAIALLVFFTPFAFGAVDVWAVGTAEIICFSLVILWLAKTNLGSRIGLTDSARRELWFFAAPVVSLVAFILFQLAPLPPMVLRLLSPQAYRLYENSLPGWPHRIAYADAEFEKSFRQLQRQWDELERQLKALDAKKE